MLDVAKLGSALPSVVGKTIERIFLVPIGEERHQVYIAFTDDTYYELYGTGSLSGGRVVDAGTVNAVRASCTRDSADTIEVGRWGAGTPHILRSYLDTRRTLVEANQSRGDFSIVSFLPTAPKGVWSEVSQVVAQSPSPVRVVSDLACELLLAGGCAFGSTPPLVLEGFLGSGGRSIPRATLVPAIALWARSPGQRTSAIKTFAQAVEDWRDSGFHLAPGLGNLVPDPEDALTAFVPNGEVPDPEWVEEFVTAARSVLNGADAPTARRASSTFRGAITGRELNRQHSLGAAHALYHKDGTWYQRLTRFPGVLCDPNGFVRFESESELLQDPQLKIGEQVNVRGTIASHPRYRRFKELREPPTTVRIGSAVRRENGATSLIDSISGPGLHGVLVVADNDLIEIVPDPEFGWKEFVYRQPGR